MVTRFEEMWEITVQDMSEHFHLTEINKGSDFSTYIRYSPTNMMFSTVSHHMKAIYSIRVD